MSKRQQEAHPYLVIPHSTDTLAALEAIGISSRRLPVASWKGSRRCPRPESYRLDIEREQEFTAALVQVVAAKKARRSEAGKQAAALVAANKASGTESRAARVRREKEEWEEEADTMGLLPDSRTFARFKDGIIDYEAAVGIGNYTRHRHQDTDYDLLLRQGYAKEDARAIIGYY